MNTEANPMKAAVTDMVVKSMFDFMSATDTGDNAREKLIVRYPEHKDFILTLKRDDEDLFKPKSKKNKPAAAITLDLNETPVVEAAEFTTPQTVVEVVLAESSKAPKKDKAIKVIVAKEPKAESKMDKARKLYADATDKSRKNMVAVFGTELGLSKAAASTYFYLVKV